MLTELQTKFSSLKTQIEEQKLLKARYEANIEQYETQLQKTKADLVALAGTDDIDELKILLEQLQEVIKTQHTEAEQLLAEAGL